MCTWASSGIRMLDQWSPVAAETTACLSLGQAVDPEEPAPSRGLSGWLVLGVPT